MGSMFCATQNVYHFLIVGAYRFRVSERYEDMMMSSPSRQILCSARDRLISAVRQASACNVEGALPEVCSVGEVDSQRKLAGSP